MGGFGAAEYNVWRWLGWDSRLDVDLGPYGFVLGQVPETYVHVNIEGHDVVGAGVTVVSGSLGGRGYTRCNYGSGTVDKALIECEDVDVTRCRSSVLGTRETRRLVVEGRQ